MNKTPSSTQIKKVLSIAVTASLTLLATSCRRSPVTAGTGLVNNPGAAVGAPAGSQFNTFRGVRDAATSFVPGEVVVNFRQAMNPQFLSQFAVQNGLQYVSTSRLGHSLFRQLNLNADPNSAQTLTNLRRNPMVQSANLNALFKRQFVINDPRASEQTGLAIIGMGKAWDLTTGSSSVTIAVIDSGADLQHPDLLPNLVPGYNVLNPGQPPQDDNGHGTHASGIAAAAGDNGQGVTGACPRCKLMPIKVLDQTGGGDGFHVAEGLVWAVDNGAHVVNMSLGTESKEAAIPLTQAIKYALARNVVVVVAAGNNASDTPMYPAATPGVISVGSVDMQRNLSSFSNFGSWVSLVAPGSGILSTMPVTSSYMTQNEGFKSEYDLMDGTSMASPMVAGVVGLIKSRHPNLTPAQIKQRLDGTAIDLGEPGFDLKFGNGMVDAFRAVL